MLCHFWAVQRQRYQLLRELLSLSVQSLFLQAMSCFARMHLLKASLLEGGCNLGALQAWQSSCREGGNVCRQARQHNITGAILTHEL